MQETKTAAREAHPGITGRKDAWWIEPLLVGVGFAIFIVYATWRAFEGTLYEAGPYLSPFYSPNLVELGLTWWKWSPAMLILWIPAGFRATCYYYRKAYYRAYFFTPPACAVDPIPQGKYTGERSFPLVFQNLHRYFFYLALVVLAVLWWDAIVAFNFDGKFGIGVGSLVLLGNVIFLSAYTFGCHALRHLIGGRLDCFSCSVSAKNQFKLWSCVTKFNEHHMLWAWVSLFSVGFADFYVRCVASGLITDIRLL